MKFTVTWAVHARDALASIWISSSDCQAITDAADRIDRDLARDGDRLATTHGKHLVYEVWPLRVYVEIDPDDYLVRVIYVESLI